MLPQTEFESPMLAGAQAPVAIAAITQDRALIGLLRSVIDPATDLLLVNSEAELTPHLNSRRVSVALLDSMFVEAALRRHEVENVERTLEQQRPDFSRIAASSSGAARGKGAGASVSRY